MEEKTHVLIVEDETRIARFLQMELEHEGFTAEIEGNGTRAYERIIQENFDIILLDVMLPGMDGIEICRRVRTVSNVPIIMLTPKGDDIDRIIGLEMGADDYVPKPCTPRELLARINAILRRAQHSNEQNNAPNSISVSDVVLYPAKRQASIKDTPLELTSTEFNLLEVLMRHAGQVVSKETLSIEALDRKLAKFDRSIDVHISSIRHKLGDASLIQTVRGLGYLFVKN